MQNRIDLFGVEPLTLEEARKVVLNSSLSPKEGQILSEAVDQRLDDVVVQALLYSLRCKSNRDYSLKELLSLEGIGDPYGRPYNDFRKGFAPLFYMLERDMHRYGSHYLVDGTTNEKGEPILKARFLDGSNPTFILAVNQVRPELGVIYEGRFGDHFPLEILENQNIFANGPVNAVIRGGNLWLPLQGITEISSIGKKVTFDRDGKHACRYNREYMRI